MLVSFSGKIPGKSVVVRCRGRGGWMPYTEKEAGPHLGGGAGGGGIRPPLEICCPPLQICCLPKLVSQHIH